MTANYNSINREVDPLEPLASSSSVSNSLNRPDILMSGQNQVDREPSRNLWYKWSVVLENKGAVARDHLANERTFLAWLRTSLAFMSIGVGVTQLFKLEKNSSNETLSHSSIQYDDSSRRYSKGLGGMFISIGILSLLFGCIRYFSVQEMLSEEKFPASRFSVAVLIGVVFCAIVVTFGIVMKVGSN